MLKQRVLKLPVLKQRGSLCSTRCELCERRMSYRTQLVRMERHLPKIGSRNLNIID
jgi:hypothetical protein